MKCSISARLSDRECICRIISNIIHDKSAIRFICTSGNIIPHLILENISAIDIFKLS